MSKIVDARGLACPQPVILTRRALQESDAVTTIVDNETARSNVSRMAAKQGCQVDVEEREDGIYVHPTKAANGRAQRHHGTGRPRAGGYPGARFHTLGEVEPLPQTIIFFNSGKLVVEGSPVMEDKLWRPGASRSWPAGLVWDTTGSKGESHSG
jgi:TusA-related sulfurtransferase